MSDNQDKLQWQVIDPIPSGAQDHIRKALQEMPLRLSIYHESGEFCIAVVSKLPFTQETAQIFTDGMNSIAQKLHALAIQKRQEHQQAFDELLARITTKKK